MGDELVRGMKRAESSSLIAPSAIVFDFHEFDQTRRESKVMATDGEFGDGCMCSLTHCCEVLDRVL